MAKLTPAMRQFFSVKDEYPDCVVMFRMGDFYEMFFEDAKICAEVLDITLTSRGQIDGEKIPLSGIPYHALDPYLAKLVQKGYKVAICEQVEDPKLAKGVVKREVVRVITPGAVLDSELLTEDANNFLLSLTQKGEQVGLAIADISTAEFLATETTVARLNGLLAQFGPAEILLPESMGVDRELVARLKDLSHVSPLPDRKFQDAEQKLRDHFEVKGLEGFGLDNHPLATAASAALLRYLEETQKQHLGFLSSIRFISPTDHMVLDEVTLRNLEILQPLREGAKGEGHTLFRVLDRTRAAMGARLLRQWLSRPLTDRGRIRERQDGIRELMDNGLVREELQSLFKSIADIERLVSKVMVGRIRPRELAALRDSMGLFPKIASQLNGCDCPPLQDMGSFDPLTQLHGLLVRSIKPEPAVSLNDGGVIRKEYSSELDELRDLRKGGKNTLQELELREKEETGIKSMRIRYNRVLGYYIEISKSNMHLVPERYIRKQTLKNAERFFTPELKDMEGSVLHAQERIQALEEKLYGEITQEVAAKVEELKEAARVIARVDVLCALAEVAIRNSYVRPEIIEGTELSITDGRHPIVEQTERDYIPNDCRIEPTEIMIITGPNMAGKSTYMRSVALIALMAQAGSFVPATDARLGIIDRIFTRVGAYDDLSHGQSTFMVEMSQTANILNNASERSLVILDEIGRGTSTFDGVAIAWSVAEFIYRRVKAKTLFATHYHVLNKLSEKLERVRNYHIQVKDKGGEIVFLRKIVPGGTDQSYGIHVAKLAGMPGEVIERAREIQDKLLAEDQMIRKVRVKTHEEQQDLLNL